MAERVETKYENLSAKYLLRLCDYQKQFSHMYSHRLNEMQKMLLPKIQTKWAGKYEVKQLCDLREEQSEKCIIIGTIYKHQVHKPSILREISEENQLAPQPPREHYADPEDKIILEDNLQRVRLQGKVDGTKLATGVVCAALGCIEGDGRFEVEELLFHESGPQRPLSNKTPEAKEMIIFMSGLSQMDAHNYMYSINLLQHWLGGNLLFGTTNQVRLIIAGNSVRSNAQQRVSTTTATSRSDESQKVVGAMRELDGLFEAWSQALPVDVMPGPNDPTNFMLPQQPLHSCMFPKAARNSSFRCVSNPYNCTVNDVLISGCSGQNVRDLLRCTFLDEPLEALRSTLIWGHIAPTAPDTLACYPYIDSDPFIHRECPHIYFTGNCENFATDLHVSNDNEKAKTRLICIPKFSKTQSVVAVDLGTLECREICFNQDD